MELHQAIMAARDAANDLLRAEETFSRWTDAEDDLTPIGIKNGQTIETSQGYSIFECSTRDEAVRVSLVIQGLAIEQQEKRIAIMRQRVAELFAGVEQS